MALSPDGSRIVTGSNDYTAKVWNAHTGECERTLQGHRDSVTSVAVSPDGSRIMTGSHDRTAKVWNAATGACRMTLRSSRENKVWVWPVAVFLAGVDGDGENNEEPEYLRQMLTENLVEIVRQDRVVKDALLDTNAAQDILDTVLRSHRALTVVAGDGAVLILLLLAYMRVAWMMEADEPREQGILAPLALTLLATSYVLAREASQALAMHSIGLFSTYVTSIWNINDLLCIGFSYALAAMVFADSFDVIPVVIGLFFLWFKVLGYIKGLSLKFAVFVFSLLRIAEDLASFIFVLLIIMIGAASIFFVLLGPLDDCSIDTGPNTVYNGTNNECDMTEEAFSSAGETMLTVFRMMLGDFERDWFRGEDNEVSRLGAVLLVIFMIIVNVLLLNILIAVVSDSYDYSMIRAQKSYRIAQLDLAAELNVLFGFADMTETQRNAWFSSYWLTSIWNEIGKVVGAVDVRCPWVPRILFVLPCLVVVFIMYIVTAPGWVPLALIDVVTACFKRVLHLISPPRRRSKGDDEDGTGEWLGRALDMERRVGHKVQNARKKTAVKIAEVKAEVAEVKAEVTGVKADVAELKTHFAQVQANIAEMLSLLKGEGPPLP